MSLKARALAASKERKENLRQRNAARTLEILKDKYVEEGCQSVEIDAGKIVGGCVIIGAGTDDELKFKLCLKYGGSRDVKVWHNDAWHSVYGPADIGDILSISKEASSSETTAERLLEVLQELMYEIAEEVACNG